jgi:hypothetical protein
MTYGELVLITAAVLYIGGIIAGGIVGAARGSTASGIVAAMLLGPLFGVMFVALMSPPSPRGPAVQPQKQPW